MIIDEDAYLEHAGVKGMKWGVRRAQAHKQGTVEKKINRKLRTAGEKHRENQPVSRGGRSFSKKAGIAAGAIVSGSVASSLASGLTKSTPISIIAATSGSIYGARATRQFVDKHGKTKISDLNGSRPGRGKYVQDKGLSGGEKVYVTAQGAAVVLSAVSTAYLAKKLAD